MKVCLSNAVRCVEDEEDVLELAGGALDLSSVARAVLREIKRCWVQGKSLGLKVDRRLCSRGPFSSSLTERRSVK